MFSRVMVFVFGLLQVGVGTSEYQLAFNSW
jgi:hypothetical protein